MFCVIMNVSNMLCVLSVSLLCLSILSIECIVFLFCVCGNILFFIFIHFSIFFLFSDHPSFTAPLSSPLFIPYLFSCFLSISCLFHLLPFLYLLYLSSGVSFFPVSSSLPSSRLFLLPALLSFCSLSFPLLSHPFLFLTLLLL